MQKCRLCAEMNRLLTNNNNNNNNNNNIADLQNANEREKNYI